MDIKHLERIGKLLRLAEKAMSSSDEEAASAMAKAQKLATEHAIDLEIARQHVASKEARKIPTIRKVTIGLRGKRLLATYCQLYLAIAASNDVTCDLAQNSTYVVAYGFESDIDVVDALYMSLVMQMVEASTAYLRSGEYKQEKVRRPVYERDSWNYREFIGYEEKSISGITARKSFQGGVRQPGRPAAEHGPGRARSRRWRRPRSSSRPRPSRPNPNPRRRPRPPPAPNWCWSPSSWRSGTSTRPTPTPGVPGAGAGPPVAAPLPRLQRRS